MPVSACVCSPSVPAAGPGVRPGCAGDMLRAPPNEAPLAALQPRERARAGLGDGKHHRAGAHRRPVHRALGPLPRPSFAGHHLSVGTGCVAAAGRAHALRPCC